LACFRGQWDDPASLVLLDRAPQLQSEVAFKHWSPEMPIEPKNELRPLSASVVSITPFTDNNELDEAALRAHLRRMAQAKLCIWAAGSGSSEGYTLSDAETVRILEIAVDELSGIVPVRAMGREPRTPDEMVRYVDMVQKTGIDAIQIYSLDPGHGHKPLASEIEAYLNDVMDRVRIPAVLSTHMCAGYFMPLEVLDRICTRFPLIKGINITGADRDYLRRAVDVMRGRVEVISGLIDQIFANLAFGGNGYASWEGNVAPKLFASMLEHYRANDMSAMFESYRRLTALSAVLMQHDTITSMKAALTLSGYPAGLPRRPRLGLSAKQMGALRADLQALDEPELREAICA
jgi:4-hydroxy-tetrahydrodipicolinate synthase